jgi:hypothetical protein
VKPRSVFLRKECILPTRLDPLREPIGEGWTRVEEIPAPVFDTMIRQAGWHYMWVPPACARRGIGMNADTATNRALTRALRSVPSRFNAAELDSVSVVKYPGFYVANVKVQSRRIQERTSLDPIDEQRPRALAAR